MMEMRDRIKQIRKSVNLTQAEFSTALGLSPTSAAVWEKKDAQIPTEPMQLLICRTFNINKHWLETGEGEMMENTNEALLAKLAEMHSLSELDVDVIQAFLNMEDSQKMVFRDMAKALKK